MDRDIYRTLQQIDKAEADSRASDDDWIQSVVLPLYENVLELGVATSAIKQAKDGPWVMDTYYNYTQLLLRIKRYSACEDVLANVECDVPWIWLRRARVQLELKCFLKARKHAMCGMNRCVPGTAICGDFALLLAATLEGLREWENAAEQYAVALRIPSNECRSNIYYDAFQCLDHARKWMGALKLARAWVSEFPDDAWGGVGLVTAHYYTGSPDECLNMAVDIPMTYNSEHADELLFISCRAAYKLGLYNSLLVITERKIVTKVGGPWRQPGDKWHRLHMRALLHVRDRSAISAGMGMLANCVVASEVSDKQKISYIKRAVEAVVLLCIGEALIALQNYTSAIAAARTAPNRVNVPNIVMFHLWYGKAILDMRVHRLVHSASDMQHAWGYIDNLEWGARIPPQLNRMHFEANRAGLSPRIAWDVRGDSAELLQVPKKRPMDFYDEADDLMGIPQPPPPAPLIFDRALTVALARSWAQVVFRKVCVCIGHTLLH